MPTKVDYQAERIENLLNWSNGKAYHKRIVSAKSKSTEYDRSLKDKIRPISKRLILGAMKPVKLADKEQKSVEMIDINAENLPKIVASVEAKINNETDYLNTYWGWVGIIMPEYELLEPYTILDTEAFFLQAVRRQHSLMFRNGFKITGENEVFRNYIQTRFDQISFMMKKTLDNFFKEILWNLLVCSNCIIVKIRDSKASGGVKNKKNNSNIPVAAYVLVPVNTIYPYLDGQGYIEKWRRFFADGRTFKDYAPEDVIHLTFDKKIGHIFGTPRTVAVKDDVLALRRLEENVEFLLVKHLFPLFHVKVGSKEAPANFLPNGASEVDLVQSEIMNMPKEGFFVTDERVEVDVAGAEGKSLDYDKVLAHYKQRIFTGLGMSPLDMGETAEGSRSNAEAVSQNLKDTVKSILSTFCGMIKMTMIRELFEESPAINMSVQNAVADVGLDFPEIDIDNMIKQETHATNLYNNHLVDQDEARKVMHRKPMDKANESKTHYKQHVLDLAMKTASAKASLKPEKAASKHKKTPANKNGPENQHGKSLDPHKARSSMEEEFLNLFKDKLKDLKEQCGTDIIKWQEGVKVIYENICSYVDEKQEEAPYTNHQRLDGVLASANSYALETQDLDMLSVYFDSLLETNQGENDA